MRAPIVIIGIGELAGEFARGFMRCGYPVYPITRQMDMREEHKSIPTPQLILITVQEQYLGDILQQLPASWRNKVGLVQNELLPKHWLKHNISHPTVAVVWFEKKSNMVLNNILYTPVFGPKTSIVTEALTALNVPHKVLPDDEALLYELSRKALYILTVNICGLVKNVSVGSLWKNHRQLALQVATEAVSILESITEEKLQSEQLIAGMVEGIKDCPDRKCLGRSAPSRLKRAVDYARTAGIECNKLNEIYQNNLSLYR